MRARLVEGVSIQAATGPLARKVAARTKSLPVQPGFSPTHLIVIEQSLYLAALDKRLKDANLSRQKRDPEFIDVSGIGRQVLISVTLLGRCPWSVGGSHTFDYSDPDFPYSSAGYSHRPTESVAGLLRYMPSPELLADIKAKQLRDACNILDCYYRDGSWWVDRLSVALGYLWSGVTSQHPELALVAFCMALEALASTSQNEITHILAERCALLCHSPGPARMELYTQVKDLYALRSKIVHGRSAPRKGPINWETLAITAKRSIVPRTQVLRMLAVTTKVVVAVMSRPRLLDLLHVKRSEEKASEAMNEYFLYLLLCGEA
jgi:hypothetical protein